LDARMRLFVKETILKKNNFRQKGKGKLKMSFMK